jgi:hypothetical protein
VHRAHHRGSGLRGVPETIGCCDWMREGTGCLQIANCKMQISDLRMLRDFLTKQCCEATSNMQFAFCNLQSASTRIPNP